MSFIRKAASAMTLSKPQTFLETLARVSLFSDLPQAALEDLALQLQPQDGVAGQVLAQAGSVGDAVWLIVHGTVEGANAESVGGPATVVLGADQVVAESLLLMGGAHTATYRFLTDTQLLRLELSAFIEIAQRYPSAWAQFVTEHMLETALSEVAAAVFGAATPSVMEFAASSQAWEHLEKGEILARQGDPVDAWYLVLSGELVALQVSGGQRAVKSFMRRGDLVGDLPLAAGYPHLTHVVATRETWLLRFRCDQFQSLFFDRPNALQGVLRSLGRHLSLDAQPVKHIAGAMRVAVVPALTEDGSACNMGSFIEEFEQALARFGPVMVLDSVLCEMLHIVSEPGKLGVDHVEWIRLSAWLERQVQAGVRVIMVGEYGMPGWNSKIALECDLLLHVAPGRASPSVDALNLPEQFALSVDTAPDGAWWRSPHWLCLLHSPATLRPAGTLAWLESLPVVEHFHVRDAHAGDIGRLARHLSGNAIGMALSGGGARGIGHAGVHHALTEAGVPVDYLAGTSAGSLLACLLGADEGPVVALQRIAQGLGSKKNLFGDYTLPLVSLLKSERLRATVVDTFGDQRLEDSWIPCAVVTTNLTQSRQQVFTRGLIRQVALASCSVPAVMKPVIIDGDLYCDGGLVNNLPVDILKAHGCRYTLASFVGSKLQLRLSDSALPGTWTMLFDRLFRSGRHTSGIPNVIELLVAATTLASDAALANIEANVDIFFEPPLSEFPALNFSLGNRLAKGGFDHASALLATKKFAPTTEQDGLWTLVAKIEMPASEAASVALAQWALQRQVLSPPSR